jgi:MFS family permease
VEALVSGSVRRTDEATEVAAQIHLPRLPIGLALVFFLILGGSYVTNAMDRQVFPALLPMIGKHYGFSLSEGGLLSTIFTLGIGVAGIPGAYLLNRYTRKTVIILGIGTYSVFTALTAVSVGFADMFIYRALSGVGEAIQNAALFAAVGAYFFKNRALAIGGLNFAYGVGAFLGPRLGAGFASSMGWQAPFYIFAIAGLVFIVVIAVAVSKRFTEQSEIVEEGDSTRVLAHVPEQLYNRNVLMLMVVAAIAGVSVYGYLGLYPTYLQQELGFSVVDAGTAAGMFGLGALMGIPAGLLGDRFNQRWILTASLIGGAVIGYLLFHGPTSLGGQSVLSFLMGTTGSGLLFTNTYSAMQRAVRPQRVGHVSGVFVSSWYLPSALAGYLFALLHDAFGWGGASVVQLTILPFVGVVALLFLNTDRLTTAKVGAAHH